MIHFSKIEPYQCFYKNDQFLLTFTSHFLNSFSSSTKITFPLSTAVNTQPCNVSSMAPKTKKTITSKPQSTLAPKQPQKPSSKAIKSGPTVNSSDEEDLMLVATSQLQATKVHCISWTTARTKQLLDWLEENSVDWQQLFSDSTKNAKDKGRQKHVAKETKLEFHKLIAIFVFSVDVNKEVHDDFAVNSGNYTKSVDNYLGWYVFCFSSFSSCSSASSRLQKKYQLFNEKLGQMGAGLKFEDVEEGSTLSNLIGLFFSLCDCLC